MPTDIDLAEELGEYPDEHITAVDRERREDEERVECPYCAKRVDAHQLRQREYYDPDTGERDEWSGCYFCDPERLAVQRECDALARSADRAMRSGLYDSLGGLE